MKIILPVILLTVTPLIGAEIRYRYGGVLGTAFGSWNAGTPFSGEFSYEQNQPDQSPGIARGDYSYTRFTFRIGMDSVTDLGPGLIQTYDRSFYPTDMFHLYPLNLLGNVGGFSLRPGAGFQLVLQDLNGTAFPNASLPGPDLRISDFTGQGASFIQLDAQQPVSPDWLSARGDITMLESIPESSSASLLLAAATVWAGRRRMVHRGTGR